VDFNGNQSIHSLLPRGWQRSVALVVVFAPALGPLQAGLRTPAEQSSADRVVLTVAGTPAPGEVAAPSCTRPNVTNFNRQK
jgi:hypothetical protein